MSKFTHNPTHLPKTFCCCLLLDNPPTAYEGIAERETSFHNLCSFGAMTIKINHNCKKISSDLEAFIISLFRTRLFKQKKLFHKRFGQRNRKRKVNFDYKPKEQKLFSLDKIALTIDGEEEARCR